MMWSEEDVTAVTDVLVSNGWGMDIHLDAEDARAVLGAVSDTVDQAVNDAHLLGYEAGRRVGRDEALTEARREASAAELDSLVERFGPMPAAIGTDWSHVKGWLRSRVGEPPQQQDEGSN